MAKIIGVIPSRFASTRFPGKPLAKINGKPLLQWVVEGSKKSKKIKDLYVATDDSRIGELAKSLGVEVLMTPSECPTGTDRIWTGVQQIECSGVINIQGDEPLVNSQDLDNLADALEKGAHMATLARSFKTRSEIDNPNVAKIVLNKFNEAIYFSRFPIPLSRSDKSLTSCYKHVGIYAYSKVFLEQFCGQNPVDIEAAEGLEQLRALWLGAKIKVVFTESDSWGVDTPEDIARVEQIMKIK